MATAVNAAFDSYEIPIRSRSVLRVYVECNFDLQVCDQGDEAAVVIGNPIAVVAENDPVQQLNANAADAPSLGRILVCGADLREHRRLQIAFAPGVWFHVESEMAARGSDSGNGTSPGILVWGPAGSKGLIRLFTPNGQMAIWFGLRRGVRG